MSLTSYRTAPPRVMGGVLFVVLCRLPLEEGLPSEASGVGGWFSELCGVFLLCLEDLAATYSPTP